MKNPISGALKQPLVRLDFLDALRGLAAIYVVVYHMVLIPSPHLELPLWAQLISQNGGMGVTLFFVVSAFSLYYTMPLRQREPRPWLSFYLHRFFRIGPLFYLWIALTLVRDGIVFGAGHGFGQILASTTFVFNLLPQQQEGFVWASWTIGIEMLFYAVFPVYFLLARNRLQAISLALSLLVIWISIKGLLPYFQVDPKSKAMFEQWSFLRHLPVFACGAIAYHTLTWEGRWVQKSRDLGIVLLVGALALYVFLVNGWLPPIFGDAYYWQAILFSMLLIGLGWAPLAGIVNKVTSYFGKISYSLYLGHPTVILVLSPAYAWIYRHAESVTLSFLLSFALTLAMTVLVAELTYRFIEKPGITLGKVVNAWVRQVASRRAAQMS